MRQYRICRRGDGYFPQTRKKGLCFWGSWMKMAAHSNGFGLYPHDDYSYPCRSLEEAERRITEFKLWLKESETAPVTYLYY